jgi:hypothetical protein
MHLSAVVKDECEMYALAKFAFPARVTESSVLKERVV